MRWIDRVYGDVGVDDPEILALIECPTFQRLRGVKQAGPSAFAYPFKTVTRFEHCLGVYLLLERLGAGRLERVAGLLHDISHTAFSHAVDFIVSSAEQDHHEELKPVFLARPDISAILERMDLPPSAFHDDSAYPLLERPLPWLCADRLDYFLRDGLACEVVKPEAARRILDGLEVMDQVIVFQAREVAREAVSLFAEMNRDWWASPGEAFIYNEFADALREGFRLGVLRKSDLLGDDAHVLKILESAGSPLIESKLDRVTHYRPEFLEGFVPRVEPKVRWLDPPVKIGAGWKRLSEL